MVLLHEDTSVLFFFPPGQLSPSSLPPSPGGGSRGLQLPAGRVTSVVGLHAARTVPPALIQTPQ